MNYILVVRWDHLVLHNLWVLDLLLVLHSRLFLENREGQQGHSNPWDEISHDKTHKSAKARGILMYVYSLCTHNHCILRPIFIFYNHSQVFQVAQDFHLFLDCPESNTSKYTNATRYTEIQLCSDLPCSISGFRHIFIYYNFSIKIVCVTMCYCTYYISFWSRTSRISFRSAVSFLSSVSRRSWWTWRSNSPRFPNSTRTSL